MSNSSFLTTASIGRAALPIFTGLLGVAAITNGVTGLTKPVTWANLLGVRIAPPGEEGKVHAEKLSSEKQALINLTTLRNVASGANLLGLTLLWQFSDMCRFSPLAADAVKRCLGISVVIGSVVTFGDALVVKSFADGADVTGDVEEHAKKTGPGHAFVAVPILGIALALLFT